MPSNQLREGETRPEVLSHVSGFPGISPLAEKLVPLEKVRALYQRVQQFPDGFRFENLLAEMRVELRVDALDSARIPAAGPVVVVANHPFGVLDGAMLAALLIRVRPDVKVLTNYLLRDVPELARHCISAESVPGQRCSQPRQHRDESSSRARVVRLAAEWWNAGRLSGGGSFSLADATGRNHRSSLERYGGASDPAHRSQCLACLFLRP